MYALVWPRRDQAGPWRRNRDGLSRRKCPRCAAPVCRNGP